MLIGIIGAKRAGKDVLAEGFMKAAATRGVLLKRLGMADALYKEVSVATGTPVESMRLRKDDFRPLLQVWGTEYRRKLFGKNYWVDQVHNTIKQDTEVSSGYIIPDVRFESEYNYIVQNGGLLIKVWRCKNSIFSRLLVRFRSILSDPHESEQHWLEFDSDFEFYNCGTITDADNYADDFVDMLMSRDDFQPMLGSKRPYLLPSNASVEHYPLPIWEASSGL